MHMGFKFLVLPQSLLLMLNYSLFGVQYHTSFTQHVHEIKYIYYAIVPALTLRKTEDQHHWKLFHWL
jgi:hypothetical protein